MGQVAIIYGASQSSQGGPSIYFWRVQLLWVAGLGRWKMDGVCLTNLPICPLIHCMPKRCLQPLCHPLHVPPKCHRRRGGSYFLFQLCYCCDSFPGQGAFSKRGSEMSCTPGSRTPWHRPCREGLFGEPLPVSRGKPEINGQGFWLSRK